MCPPSLLASPERRGALFFPYGGSGIPLECVRQCTYSKHLDQNKRLGYIAAPGKVRRDSYGAEDRATQGCDPSAAQLVSQATTFPGN